MRKVVLTLKENEKYKTIKKLVETNGNKKRAATLLREREILSPRIHKITKKNIKKKLLEQQRKAKTKKEKA